jgi:2-polyprenyl-6-methoxyphenol hydroxylase-like FAD-dependent oxidoreductase
VTGPIAQRWDLVVVGARISGALTAHALAPYARSVLVLDRSGPGAYWPQQLSWDRPDNLIWHELGLTDTVLACGAPRLRGHTRRTMDVTVDYHYPSDDEHCYRMSVPREVLDPALAAHAASQPNVTLLRRAKVTDVVRDSGRVTGVRFGYQGTEHEVRCDLVVFADGRTSRSADRVGAVPYRTVPSPWTGLLSYYRDLPLPDDRIHYSRQPGSMLIVTPCGPSLWCVATGLHQALIAQRGEHPARTYARTAHADPVIGPALAVGRPTTPIGGAGKLRMHRHPMAGPGWCLVGDAGYHLDPMSALGARAVLTTVRLLRDRIANIGEVSPHPDAYRGLTGQRDSLLAAEWGFTERILHSYAPDAGGIERARWLAGNPAEVETELRVRMGLGPAGRAARQPTPAGR